MRSEAIEPVGIALVLYLAPLALGLRVVDVTDALCLNNVRPRVVCLNAGPGREALAGAIIRGHCRLRDGVESQNPLVLRGVEKHSEGAKIGGGKLEKGALLGFEAYGML